mgnify:CR=1 FL=1
MNIGLVIMHARTSESKLSLEVIQLLDESLFKICFVNTSAEEAQKMVLLPSLQQQKNVTIINAMKSSSLENSVKAGARYLINQEDSAIIIHSALISKEILKVLHAIQDLLKNNEALYCKILTNSTRVLRTIYTADEFLQLIYYNIKKAI